MAIRQTYVRMPEELHKKLRHEAAEYDVSLNQCIITLLAEALEARRVSAPNAQHKL
ncbi:MAG: toxin-antitoxin system HicB family antitoxin [Synergistaceae bacterium]|nr:toxin-antitoxin system HicB family antitoxin [Synergistaceae bacterium]MBQ4431285.1 toxin-antitoxin system HicB family antitoxin [Synergistaceae bacterium]